MVFFLEYEQNSSQDLIHICASYKPIEEKLIEKLLLRNELKHFLSFSLVRSIWSQDKTHFLFPVLNCHEDHIYDGLWLKGTQFLSQLLKSQMWYFWFGEVKYFWQNGVHWAILDLDCLLTGESFVLNRRKEEKLLIPLSIMEIIIKAKEHQSVFNVNLKKSDYKSQQIKLSKKYFHSHPYIVWKLCFK